VQEIKVMMFGYATKETDNYMPLALDISHKILQVLGRFEKGWGCITYLRPDAKATGNYWNIPMIMCRNV